MECVFVGIDPKEVLQTVSMENVSSAVYLDNLDDCLRYISGQSVDIVFMRSDFPREDKKDFTLKLQRISPATVVMDVNEHTDDFMLIKPIPKENMEDTLKLLKPITEEKRKDIFIRTFGRFVVSRHSKPCHFNGKAKEILAFLVARRGMEASNGEIYSALWENRPYSNRDMTVYYNALRRLKAALANQGLSDLLVSGSHSQKVNTDLFNCDYYDLPDGRSKAETGYEKKFLSEYSWGESILCKMMSEMNS